MIAQCKAYANANLAKRLESTLSSLLLLVLPQDALPVGLV
jgi:hypothetical protein